MKVNKEDVLGLEIHTYAPEMNKLVTNNGTKFNCPQITDIDEAIEHVNDRVLDDNEIGRIAIMLKRQVMNNWWTSIEEVTSKKNIRTGDVEKIVEELSRIL